MKTQGHAWDRHGSDVLDGQLKDRAMYKVDPISQTKENGLKAGAKHKCAGTATQFTSERAMVQAVKSIENSTDFKDKLSDAVEKNKKNPGEVQTIKVTTVSIESSLGPNYLQHVRGRTKVDTSVDPSGNVPADLTNGHFVAIYVLDLVTNTFNIHTLYPNR